MADEEQQQEPYFPPPLPEAYAIPRAAIDGWVALPQDDYVDAKLTRRDWDKLFESFDKMLQAQWAFQDSMVSYTNSNVAAANEHYSKSRHLLVESQNAFKTMFTSLMISAARPK